MPPGLKSVTRGVFGTFLGELEALPVQPETGSDETRPAGRRLVRKNLRRRLRNLGSRDSNRAAGSIDGVDMQTLPFFRYREIDFWRVLCVRWRKHAIFLFNN